MKKSLIIILFLLLLPSVASAKQLWEYGSFSERNLKWQEISQEKYQGSYQQNIRLLDYYENQPLGRAASSQSAMSMLGDITMNGKNIYGALNATTTNFISTGIASTTTLFNTGTASTTNLIVSKTATSTALCLSGSGCITSWTTSGKNAGWSSTSTPGMQTIAHGLGSTPTFIKFTAYGSAAGNVAYFTVGASTTSTTTQSYIYMSHVGEYGNSTGNSVGLTSGTGSVIAANATGKLWSMDATNFTLNWTSVGSAVYFLWEAEY